MRKSLKFNPLTEQEKQGLFTYVKKYINNVDFKVLELIEKFDNSFISLKIYVEDDGEINLGINRKKKGFSVLTTG